MRKVVSVSQVRIASFAFALALQLSWTLFAQNIPPALMVQGNNRQLSLRIADVDVDVRVLGMIAETRVTLTFQNNLNRPLAGDLYFPLPEGATVSGYALDVNGVMVDGVVVAKDKARQVFEKEVRRGVDPGLVEWTRGNHFKTRVFPIPARGTRTVRVDYVSSISSDSTNNTYRLPCNFKRNMDRLHMRLEVVKTQTQPVFQKGAQNGLRFRQWQNSFIAESTQTNATLAGELVIALPEVDQQRVLVERADDGQYYFCVNDLPADPRPVLKQRVLPSITQVNFFWDVSGSRGGATHARELDFLKAWFKIYSAHTLAVNLVPFRNSLGPIQPFTIKGGDASALLNAIAGLDYDGATQLGCLTNLPARPPGAINFLFTDGIENFGQPEPPASIPLHIFSADLTADQPFLVYLAQRSGGAFFPLRTMTDHQVLVAIAGAPFSFLGAEQTPGVEEIYPRITRPLAGRFALLGKLSSTEAELVLNYGAGGKSLAQTKVVVARKDAVEGSLLRRLWAQKKLEDLLVFQKQNESEITEVGKQYGLVTPFTSLLVLETLDQYVEHQVLPPASLPSLRTEYARLTKLTSAEKQAAIKKDREHVLELWKARVAWWNQKFQYPENYKYTEAPAKSAAASASDRAIAPQHPTPIPGISAAVDATAPAPPVMAPEPNAGWATNVAHTFRSEPKSKASRESEPGIAIKEWDPKTPYIQVLKKASPGEAYAAYLAQRQKYAASPAFFLDCAEFFRKQQQTNLAVQILSNLAELELENPALLRVLAYRLLQIGQLEDACRLFEQVLKMRPEEPQSCRDLALALTRRGQQNNNRADLVRSMDLLAQVVNKKWDRFQEIEVIALMELNAVWADCARRFPNENFAFPVDERQRALLDLDLRIALTWDADMTDIDLHLVEPSGERAMYSHNRTTIGGLVSRDFTQGYGPEEYCLRRAMHGTYKIEVNYFSSQARALMGPVTVQAEVITNFGRPNEKRKSLTLRLEEQKQTATVGEVEF